MKCRFWRLCKGYRKEAFTCAHEDEASTYCGLYRRHKAAILRIDMQAMLKGSEFGEVAE